MERRPDPIPVPRRATAADLPALVRLINAAYRVEDFFVRDDRTSEAAIATALSVPGTTFLVVDVADGSGLAGGVLVRVSGGRGYFGMLSVDPAHQRRGLGRALVAAAEAHCRDAGCALMEIDVVDVRTELPPFYHRLGYVAVGTAPFPHPARLRSPAHLVIMRKSLAAG